MPDGSEKLHHSSTIATLFVYSASTGNLTVSVPSNDACSMDKDHGDISRGRKEDHNVTTREQVSTYLLCNLRWSCSCRLIYRCSQRHCRASLFNDRAPETSSHLEQLRDPNVVFPLYTHPLTIRAIQSERESTVLLWNEPYVEDGTAIVASQMESEVAKGGRFDNSTSCVRNIFIRNGRVAILTLYHKMMSKTGKTRPIWRFLPDRLGRLLIIYIWVVRPFAAMMDLLLNENSSQQQTTLLFSVDYYLGLGVRFRDCATSCDFVGTLRFWDTHVHTVLSEFFEE